MVEAAVLVPVFLAAVLSLAYLSRVTAIQETAVHILCDEARSFSAVSGAFHEAERAGISTGELPQGLREGAEGLSGLALSGEVSDRLRQEWGRCVIPRTLTRFETGITENGIGDLVKLKYEYDVPIPIPLAPTRRIGAAEGLTFRAFTGAERMEGPMDFSEMEREADSRQVWVFPRAGERYHVKSCGVIAVEPEERLLGEAVRRKYRPCELCGSSDLELGSVVYCFSRSGRVYHRKSCASVTRYVVEMEREEAVRRGYTPCGKCGGGG